MVVSGFVCDGVIMGFAKLKINWQNMHFVFAIMQSFGWQNGTLGDTRDGTQDGG
jgi:hypothetical protein